MWAQAKERDAVKAGKKPFFLKKSAKRRAELVAKYEELKGSGNLMEQEYLSVGCVVLLLHAGVQMSSMGASSRCAPTARVSCMW